VPADALAGLLGTNIKEASAMCSKLLEDRILCA
jgi:hypothetical protein